MVAPRVRELLRIGRSYILLTARHRKDIVKSKPYSKTVVLLLICILGWLWKRYQKWMVTAWGRSASRNLIQQNCGEKQGSSEEDQSLESQAVEQGSGHETALVQQLRQQIQAEQAKREAERVGRIKAESALRRNLLAQRINSKDEGSIVDSCDDGDGGAVLENGGTKESRGFMMTPIGHLRSCFRKRFGTPRQGAVVAGGRGVLRIEERHNPQCSTDGLGEYSHVWLIYLFHENTNISRHGGSAAASHALVRSKVRPPRLGGGTKVGLFSTRTPHRPNPIGLSLVRLDRIGQGGELYLSGLDLIDGTPILDVKPYLPFADAPHACPFPHNAPLLNPLTPVTLLPRGQATAQGEAEAGEPQGETQPTRGEPAARPGLLHTSLPPAEAGCAIYTWPVGEEQVAVARTPRWIAEPVVPPVHRVVLQPQAAAALQACAPCLEFYREEGEAMWHTIREVLRNDIRSPHMRSLHPSSSSPSPSASLPPHPVGDKAKVTHKSMEEGESVGGTEEIEGGERGQARLCIDNLIVTFHMTDDYLDEQQHHHQEQEEEASDGACGAEEGHDASSESAPPPPTRETPNLTSASHDLDQPREGQPCARAVGAAAAAGWDGLRGGAGGRNEAVGSRSKHVTTAVVTCIELCTDLSAR